MAHTERPAHLFPEYLNPIYGFTFPSGLSEWYMCLPRFHFILPAFHEVG